MLQAGRRVSSICDAPPPRVPKLLFLLFSADSESNRSRAEAPASTDLQQKGARRCYRRFFFFRPVRMARALSSSSSTVVYL